MANQNLNSAAISDELFAWLKINLQPQKTILEFGSGTGTIELTKHWKVYSVEQDKRWIGKAEKSNYIFAPIKNGWYDESIVFSSLPKDYDIILIDGPAGSDLRSGIDKHIFRFKKGVPIILDDTHRQKDKDHALKLADMLQMKWEEFKGWEKNFIVLTP